MRGLAAISAVGFQPAQTLRWPSDVSRTTTRPQPLGKLMKVWIDGDRCTGVGLCESACPDVFVMANDGIAHVMDAAMNALPSRTTVDFAETLLENVIEAAEACPEACIYIEA